MDVLPLHQLLSCTVCLAQQKGRPLSSAVALCGGLPGKREIKERTAVDAREASQEKNITFFSSSSALTSIRSCSEV